MVFLESLVIPLLNPSKPAHFQDTTFSLIISVVCVCLLDINHIGNPNIAIINLSSDGDISDTSSRIEVINP